MAKTDKKDKKSNKLKLPPSAAKVPVSSTEILAKATAATRKHKVKPAKKNETDSGDSEAPLEKVVANGKPKKPQDSSSDESTESSSEEEKPKTAQVKAAVGKVASSGSSSSSDSDDEQPRTKKPIPAKAIPSSHPNVPKKQQAEASSDDSSDSDGETVKKVSDTKPAGKANKAPSKTIPQPKQQADSEEESSDEDSSDDEPVKTEKVPSAAKKAKAIPAKAASSSSSSSSEESSDEADEKSVKNVKPALVPSKAKATPTKATSPTSEESSSDESDEKSKTNGKASVKTTAKEASSDSDEEDSSEESADEDGDVKMGDSTAARSKTSKRKATDDAPVPPKKVRLADGEATPAGEKTEETKSIFVGRLSWSVDSDRLAQEFASCGEVVSATVPMDRNTGKSRGFGYVHFATSDAVEKALGMNGMEIDGRSVNIDRSMSMDKFQAREKRAKTFGDSINPPSSTLFVGNLSFGVTEDTVWSFFNDYGVKSVRLPTDRESGRPKGFGYVEFEDVEGAKKAFEASKGAEIEGRPIRLDYSQPRDGPGGGGGRNDFGRGRNDFGRGRGDFGGGRNDFGRGRGQGRGRGRGGDRGGRGGRGARGGGARSGGIAAFEGRKITF